jgi:hypothetical protein
MKKEFSAAALRQAREQLLENAQKPLFADFPRSGQGWM